MLKVLKANLTYLIAHWLLTMCFEDWKVCQDYGQAREVVFLCFFGSYRLYNSTLNIDDMFHSVEEYAGIMGQARGVVFLIFFARGPDS